MLQTLAVQSFPLPGDASFPLNSMFERPPNRQDAGMFLSVLRSSSSNPVYHFIFINNRYT